MNYLQHFSTKEILTNHQEVCLEINAKWDTEIPEKGSNIKFTGHPNETCNNKCQEHIGCSYRHKVVCMDDRFNKPIKIPRWRCDLRIHYSKFVY